MRGRTRLGFVPVALLFGYFLWFASPACQAQFAPDDMMNLAYYWRRGLAQTLADCVMFWSSAYRPMGGVFYLPLYHFFGLHPLPYHLVASGLLCVNWLLAYAVAWRLSHSRIVAGLTAMLVIAHAAMNELYYNPSSVYDVLAFFFMFSAFLVYLDSRGGRWRIAAVVALYICALDSKEIAAIFPLAVLAYEALVRLRSPEIAPPPAGRALLIILFLITAAYVPGRVFGPQALAKQPGYRLEFSAERYISNHLRYVTDIFYAKSLSRWQLAAFFALLLALIARAGTAMAFAACYILFATLPIAFTPVKSGGSLYVPLFGYALLCVLIVKKLIPDGRWWVAAAITGIVVLIATETEPKWQFRGALLLENHRETSDAIRKVQQLDWRPPAKSRVLLVNGPFPEYELQFIAELVWNDHSLDVRPAHKLPKNGHPAPTFDYVVDFAGENAIVFPAKTLLP